MEGRSLFSFPPRHPGGNKHPSGAANQQSQRKQGPQHVGTNLPTAIQFGEEQQDLPSDINGPGGDIVSMVGPQVRDPLLLLRSFFANFRNAPVSPGMVTARSVVFGAPVAGQGFVNIDIPDGALLMRVTYSYQGNVYFSLRRQALRAPDWLANGGGDDIIVNPQDDWYFCYGLRQVSVNGDDGAIITLQFYVQSEIMVTDMPNAKDCT